RPPGRAPRRSRGRPRPCRRARAARARGTGSGGACRWEACLDGQRKHGVAAAQPMETFGKACPRFGSTSATVNRVGRLALLACSAALLLAGGAAAALLAPGSDAAATTSTSTATTTTTSSAPPPAADVSTAPAVVAFTGHGWGHGLGFAQWGAYGYALHGLAYDKILAHYYPGTTLGQARVATVRVLVASKQKITLSSTTPWTIVDSTGAKTQLDAGQLVFDSTFTVD